MILRSLHFNKDEAYWSIVKVRRGTRNTVEENSGVFSLIECASCLQCFDTVDWAAGRASGL